MLAYLAPKLVGLLVVVEFHDFRHVYSVQDMFQGDFVHPRVACATVRRHIQVFAALYST